MRHIVISTIQITNRFIHRFPLIAYRTSILLGRELNGDHRACDLFDDGVKSPGIRRMRKPIKSFPDIARASFGHGGTIFLSLVLYFGEWQWIGAWYVCTYSCKTLLQSFMYVSHSTLNRTLLLSLYFLCNSWRSSSYFISKCFSRKTHDICLFRPSSTNRTLKDTETPFLPFGESAKPWKYISN